MDPEDLQKILEQALWQGGEFADVFVEHRIRRQISLDQRQIEELHLGVEQGLGVRVVRGESTGYAYADQLGLNAGLQAAQAARTVVIQPRPSRVSVTPESRSFDRGLTRAQIPLETLPEDRRIEVVRRAEEAGYAYSEDVVNVMVSYTEDLRRFQILTSEGILTGDEQPVIYFTVQVLAQRGDRRHLGRKRVSIKGGFELFDQISPEEVAREAAREAVAMLDAVDAPAGEMPVVLEKGFGGVLFHEAIGHGLEGDTVAEGSSFYTGKLGEKVGSELVTLLDDATLPHARGSYNVDDEGTPSQKTVLIDRGVLVAYMTDIRSAKKLGLSRTGNGRRESYRYPPLVRMSNTYILSGDTPPEEIIRSTKYGLYCKSFSGGQVDPTSGTFTFTVREAYLIENGELTRPVRGATLIGNGPEVLRTIDLVGNDWDIGPGTCGKGQWVPVTSGQPTLRIGKITVGGRA